MLYGEMKKCFKDCGRSNCECKTQRGLIPLPPTELTQNQKLQALAEKFYCGGREWHPKVGDYYTSSRNDLELYQVVDEDEEHFYTIYCNNPDGGRAKWRKDEFTTEGFGLNRVHVHTAILQ